MLKSVKVDISLRGQIMTYKNWRISCRREYITLQIPLFIKPFYEYD